MNRFIEARFLVDYAGFRLDADLRLPGKGISVLFGPSGSGKTTLLRCIAGLQRARPGFLQINGNVWQDDRRGLFLPAHKRSLGYVFQDANLFAHLDVWGNLSFGLKRLAGKTTSDSERIVQMLGIGHLRARMPDRLSGGERRRVAIARALVLNPDLLLMDEPMAGLDVRRKEEILPYLSKLHRELDIPVIYVTHSRFEVAQLADHLVLLNEGRVTASGPVHETLTRVDLPLAHDPRAGTVWPVVVGGHELQDGLTRVSFDGGSLILPYIDIPVGRSLRLLINARDVSVTLEIPKQTSILNVLPATITGLAEDPRAQCVVRFQVGNQTLLAHISRKSARSLNLQPGMPVHVQIKGTSISDRYFPD